MVESGSPDSSPLDHWPRRCGTGRAWTWYHRIGQTAYAAASICRSTLGAKEIAVNRSDFQALADVRIEEAQALLGLAPPRPDGAYYLAGYAVECALKAALAKLNQQHDWPE
jgi:hypothetical protein